MENGRLKFSHCTAVQLPLGNLIKNTIRKSFYMSLEHYCIPELQIKPGALDFWGGGKNFIFSDL